MRAHKSVRHLLTAAIAGLALVLTLVVVPLSYSDPDPAPKTTGRVPAGPAVKNVKSHFEVSRIANGLVPSVTSQVGLETAQDPTVRVFSKKQGGATVQAAVGERKVCLAVDSGTSESSGCADTASAVAAAKPPISVDFLEGGQFRVSGLVVDGVTDVRVLTGSAATAAPVQTNTFSVVVAEAPTAVEWTGPSNTRYRLALDG